jgi:hypothetical protein
MRRVWSVYAIFDDGDSTSWILIGKFTKKSVAKSMKTKWNKFFTENNKILNQPQNWTPEKDEWYSQNYDYGDFDWFDSKEYSTLMEQHGYILQFSEITIDECKLDEDVFVKNMPWSDFSKLALNYNRDYKINKIIE